MIEYRTGHAICLVFRGTVLFSRDKLGSKLVGPYKGGPFIMKTTVLPCEEIIIRKGKEHYPEY